VLKRSRELCTLTVRSPLPLALAAINHDLLAVNASWTGIASVDDRMPIEEAFHFGLGVLVAVLVERHLVAPLDQSLRRVLLAAASVPFDWPAWLEGYLAVRDEHGVDEARRRLGVLAELHDELRGKLDAQLTRELLDGKDVSPKAKQGKKHKLCPLAPLRRSILAKFETIASAPLLPTIGGTCSIADVLAEIAEHRVVLHVQQAPINVGDVPRLVLVLPRVERALLERLVGTSRLRPGDEWVETWRTQNAFERREPLASLAV
jgi:hypothetical protein